MRSKKITPAALVALQDALTHIYWYKSDLRSFLTSIIENRAIVNFPNWDDRKRNIVRELVTHLARNEDQYQADLVRLIVEVCRMTDFSHLQRLEDGAAKAQEARLAVQALRTHAAFYSVTRCASFSSSTGQCCKKYFEASKVLRRITLCSDLKETLDKLRLTHRVIPV